MSRPTPLLTLIRHGETSANRDGVWHGSTDTPLSERGRAQAQRVAALAAERFSDAAALYCSPLQRARDTARPIGEALGLVPTLEPALVEYDLGRWEGLSYRALHAEHDLWEQMKRDPDFAPHGGESPRQVAERFTAALLRIGGAHPGQRVLIVVHGGALTLALGQLLDGSYAEWRRVMDNGAVSELAVGEPPELVSFNDIAHLGGL